MLDRRAATLVVERDARQAYNEPMKVLTDLTIAREWGWVMYVATEAQYFMEQVDEARARFPAYLVNRVTGELGTAGKAWPIEKYIEDYETRLASIDQV